MFSAFSLDSRDIVRWAIVPVARRVMVFRIWDVILDQWMKLRFEVWIEVSAQDEDRLKYEFLAEHRESPTPDAGKAPASTSEADRLISK